MGVAHSADVLGRGREFHRETSLADHGAGLGAEDVDAQHAVGGLVGQYFHKPLRGAVRAAARIGGERILADLVGNARGLELFLGLADPGHLGLGVDHGRHEIPVHVALLPGQRLDAGDAVLARLVRQHRPVDHVANGVDAGHRCLEVAVDGDAAAVREFHAHLVEPETGHVGTPPDRHQHDIGLERLGRTALRGLDGERNA